MTFFLVHTWRWCIGAGGRPFKDTGCKQRRHSNRSFGFTLLVQRSDGRVPALRGPRGILPARPPCLEFAKAGVERELVSLPVGSFWAADTTEQFLGRPGGGAAGPLLRAELLGDGRALRGPGSCQLPARPPAGFPFLGRLPHFPPRRCYLSSKPSSGKNSFQLYFVD